MNRSKINLAAGDDFKFIPGYDAALLGYAHRLDSRVPCYSWMRAKRWLAQEPALEAAKILQGLFLHEVNPAPLILMPVNKPYFWSQVQQGRIKVWDQLHDAIIGTGRRQLGPEVAVYSYPRVINGIQRLVEAAGELSPEEFFSSQLDVWQGPGTPWTLHPVQ